LFLSLLLLNDLLKQILKSYGYNYARTNAIGYNEGYMFCDKSYVFTNLLISSVKKLIRSGALVKNSIMLILFLTEHTLPTLLVPIVLLHIALNSIKEEFLSLQSSLENPLIAVLNPRKIKGSISNRNFAL
jgi:hypothetical protein